MNYKYNRQDRIFTGTEPAIIRGKEVIVSLDTSYKESEYDSKIQTAISRIEANWSALCEAMIHNLYEIHIESWRYEKEKDLSTEDFLNNLCLKSVLLTKNDSCTLQFTTGDLFEGRLLEIIFDNDDAIYITGLLD